MFYCRLSSYLVFHFVFRHMYLSFFFDLDGYLRIMVFMEADLVDSIVRVTLPWQLKCFIKKLYFETIYLLDQELPTLPEHLDSQCCLCCSIMFILCSTLLTIVYILVLFCLHIALYVIVLCLRLLTTHLALSCFIYARRNHRKILTTVGKQIVNEEAGTSTIQWNLIVNYLFTILIEMHFPRVNVYVC